MKTPLIQWKTILVVIRRGIRGQPLNVAMFGNKGPDETSVTWVSASTPPLNGIIRGQSLIMALFSAKVTMGTLTVILMTVDKFLYEKVCR